MIRVVLTIVAIACTQTHSPEVTRGTDGKQIVLNGGSRGVIRHIGAIQRYGIAGETAINLAARASSENHGTEVTRGTDGKKVVLNGGSRGVIARLRVILPIPPVTYGWNVKAEPTVKWQAPITQANWAVLAKPTVRWQSDRTPGWEVDAEPTAKWLPSTYVAGFAVTPGTPVSWTAVAGSDVPFQVRAKPTVTWVVEDTKPVDCVSGDGLGPSADGPITKNYVF